MKPTQEKILQWAREVWGDDSGKPWSDSALLHITELATLAYEAGRKDENEACAKVCEDAIASISEFHPEIVNEVGTNVCTNLAAAIRARGER